MADTPRDKQNARGQAGAPLRVKLSRVPQAISGKTKSYRPLMTELKRPKRGIGAS